MHKALRGRSGYVLSQNLSRTCDGFLAAHASMSEQQSVAVGAERCVVLLLELLCDASADQRLVAVAASKALRVHRHSAVLHQILVHNLHYNHRYRRHRRKYRVAR